MCRAASFQARGVIPFLPPGSAASNSIGGLLHVVSHTNAAVDAVRRAEHWRRQRTGEETLEGSRQLRLYGEDGFDRARRRELRTRILAPELKTGLAWALQEQLRPLWQYQPSAAGVPRCLARARPSPRTEPAPTGRESNLL
jgi:hypothetical protein